MIADNQSWSDLEDFLTGQIHSPAATAKPLPGAEPTDKSPAKAPEAAPKVDAQRGTDFLRDRAFAAFMSAAIDKDLAARLPIMSFEGYHVRLLQDLGNPSDPIVRMLAEQIVVTHFQFLGLHVRMAHSKTPAEIGVLGTTASHLMAEFRRSSAALQQMRKSGPVATEASNSTSTHAHAGNLPGTDKLGDSVEPELTGKNAARTKLSSNAVQESSDDRTSATVPFQKPTPRRRRKAKSA